MKIHHLVIGCLVVCLFLMGQGCCAYPTEDYSKVLVLHLNISRGTVNEQSVEMQYGHPPNFGLQGGDIHGSLKTSTGEVLREFDLWDPRYQLGDATISDNDSYLSLMGAVNYTDTADFTLVMPYYKDQMTLDLTDKRTGRLLKSVNFSGAIDRFQSTYPGDLGTGAAPAPGFRLPLDGPMMYLITGCVLVILLAAMILSMIRKK
jgi:hypothetical protein